MSKVDSIVGYRRRRADSSSRRGATVLRVVIVIGCVLVGSIGASTPDRTGTDRPEDKDKRLGERLIRKAANDRDEELMEGIIRLMTQSARSLEIAFDAGDDTQAVQERIMERLDEAIKVAASQRRPTRSTRQRSGADKRKTGKGEQQAGESRESTSPDGRDPSASGEARGQGPTSDDQATRGDLRERRRSWGSLPMRDREEIIQGVSDQFLERYRTWIERYYRALQETED